MKIKNKPATTENKRSETSKKRKAPPRRSAMSSLPTNQFYLSNPSRTTQKNELVPPMPIKPMGSLNKRPLSAGKSIASPVRETDSRVPTERRHKSSYSKEDFARRTKGPDPLSLIRRTVPPLNLRIQGKLSKKRGTYTKAELDATEKSVKAQLEQKEKSKRKKQFDITEEMNKVDQPHTKRRLVRRAKENHISYGTVGSPVSRKGHSQVIEEQDYVSAPRDDGPSNLDDEELAIFGTDDLKQKIRRGVEAAEEDLENEAGVFAIPNESPGDLLKQTADFHKKLMSTHLRKRSPRGTSTESEHDVDLDASLSIGLKNDFEEFDEEVNLQKQTRLVGKKYKDKTYPGSLSHDELVARSQNHLACVPLILKGELVSMYYAEAAEIRKRSSSLTASNAEFNRIEFSRFTIGFYGLKRQAVLAQLIAEKYKDEIQETLRKNKTMEWWSKSSFVLYVLAPEVATRMAAEELSIDLDDAADLFLETIDYGKYITDLVPIE
jgi:hypothetical protein